MSYLLDLVRLSIDDVSVKKISGRIGRDSATTVEAIDLALPMLVGALSCQARQDGAARLIAAIETDRSGGILSDVSGYLKSADSVGNQRILDRILGRHVNLAAHVLGAASGLDARQACRLLGTLAPILLDAIGKARKVRNLGPAAVSEMLTVEESDVERRSPQLMYTIWGLLDSNGKGDVDLDALARRGAALMNDF